MYHPSRGGVRGGRDQFNWDDVKADKHRKNYLGHIIKAPLGRWQKGVGCGQSVEQDTRWRQDTKTTRRWRLEGAKIKEKRKNGR